jgi:hypothetical protein
MLLVPRQLQRHGMTGAVPYYGGRLTPWHINAIKEQARTPSAPPAAGTPPAPPAAGTQRGVFDALTYLRNTGVISAAEFDNLRARAGV